MKHRFKISFTSKDNDFKTGFMFFETELEDLAQIADELAESGVLVGHQLYTNPVHGADKPTFEIYNRLEVAIGQGIIASVRPVDVKYVEADDSKSLIVNHS